MRNDEILNVMESLGIILEQKRLSIYFENTKPDHFWKMMKIEPYFQRKNSKKINNTKKQKNSY